MMGREEFFKKTVRILLFSILAIIGILLGAKAVSGNDCSRCPGLGTCSGKSDCGNY